MTFFNLKHTQMSIRLMFKWGKKLNYRQKDNPNSNTFMFSIFLQNLPSFSSKLMVILSLAMPDVVLELASLTTENLVVAPLVDGERFPRNAPPLVTKSWVSE